MTGEREKSRLALACIGVALVTLLLFAPVAGYPLLEWDDQDFIANNRAYRGLSVAHLQYIFTGAAGTFGYFAPVAWLSFAVDHFVSGVSARGVHLHSLLLHVVNSVLMLLAAHRLLGLVHPGRPRMAWAAVAALLFALHPLRAEPVAWAAGRAYLLAGTFLLVSLLAYLRSARVPITPPRRSAWLVVSVTAFAASVFAVPIAIGFPLVLVALDVYPLKRLRSVAIRRAVVEKLPFVAIAILAAVLAPLAKSTQGALSEATPWPVRIAIAGYCLAFGPVRTVAPVDLSPLYQLHRMLDPYAMRFMLSGLAVVIITGGALLARRRCPGLLVAWVSYLVLIAPVSGLVRYGLQIAADRYTYVACMGFAVLAAGLGLWAGSNRARGRSALLLAVLSLVALSLATRRYLPAWRSDPALWSRVLELDPASYTALNNLGVQAERQGRIPEAADLFRRAAACNSTYLPLRNNLGHIAALQGRLDAAIAHYTAYLSYRPRATQSRIMLATVLARAGRFDEAVEQARMVQGPQASPTTSYAVITAALMKQGHDAAAVRLTRDALARLPDDPVLTNNLTWLLATSHDPQSRDGEQAVALAGRLVPAAERYQRAEFYATVAAAYARAGDFVRAIAALGRAVSIAGRQNNAGLLGDYEAMRQQFEAGRPWTEPGAPPSAWADASLRVED